MLIFSAVSSIETREEDGEGDDEEERGHEEDEVDKQSMLKLFFMGAPM